MDSPIDPVQLLTNVLADAFAHHEASDAVSLVRADTGREAGEWVGAFLDWQRAGAIAARVLDLAGETTDGRPLFTIPARLVTPEREVATADAAPAPSAVAHSDANLIGRVMGIAREIYPVSARRHRWLLREIRRSHPSASLAVLQDLTDEQLTVMLDKLEAERRVLELRELGPGVHSGPLIDPRATAAFAQLRAQPRGVRVSAEATGWVWKHSPYSGAQLLVHLAIADVVNDVHDNEFWMSRSVLAAKAKVSTSTVTTVLADMVEGGLLVVLEAGGATRRPTRFQFEMPASATTALARPNGGLVDSGFLGQPARVTEPLVGLDTRDQRASARPIEATSLGQPARAIPKEKSQDPKGASLVERADPNCVRCRGEGKFWNGGAGFEMQCPCTAEPRLAVVQ